MVDTRLGGTAQPHIPEDHLPPVTHHCLSLCLLCGCQVALLAVSVLDEGLDSHSWPVLFEILVIRVHLSVSSALHHVSHHVWSGSNDHLGHQNRDVVLEWLLLVGWSVHLVKIDRDVYVERLDNVVVINTIGLLVFLETTIILNLIALS